MATSSVPAPSRAVPGSRLTGGGCDYRRCGQLRRLVMGNADLATDRQLATWRLFVTKRIQRAGLSIDGRRPSSTMDRRRAASTTRESLHRWRQPSQLVEEVRHEHDVVLLRRGVWRDRHR